MTLLQMVNAVRGKLREERVKLISADDDLTTEIKSLINDAGSSILEGDDWEFDVRHDGQLWFPASQSGTGAGFAETEIIDSATSAILFYADDSASGEVFENAAAIDLAGFRCSGNRLRARIVLTDSAKGNTSWIISSVDHNVISLVVKISGGFKMPLDTTGNAWTTYANEIVLPDTVKDVLSVRHEEEPIRLEFIDREMDFDRYVPRSTDSFSSVPDVVHVGGTITSTARLESNVLFPWTDISVEAAVTGPGVMIWPPSDSDLHLQYSYRVQHADLAAATDEWVGVPDNIIHAIEWLAYQFALDSGIQNDPEAAKRAERQVEKRIARARNKQSRQPNRRRVPRSHGATPSGSSRRRWESQIITAPS
jgi:hypothetical protein